MRTVSHGEVSLYVGLAVTGLYKDFPRENCFTIPEFIPFIIMPSEFVKCGEHVLRKEQKDEFPKYQFYHEILNCG